MSWLGVQVESLKAILCETSFGVFVEQISLFIETGWLGSQVSGVVVVDLVETKTGRTNGRPIDHCNHCSFQFKSLERQPSQVFSPCRRQAIGFG